MENRAIPAHKPTVYQIVDQDGSPSKAAHTVPIWVDKQQSNVFSKPTEGNAVVPFLTAHSYFLDLIESCNNAKDCIYIAGWQVNWDALLAPDLRLIDLVMNCAIRGVNIYVMPWNDTEPVQTYDDQCKAVLEGLNSILKDKQGAGKIIVELCPSFAGLNSNYFSHHQKQVVIDRQVAYVGGIDLAYGRFDDEHYRLKADWLGREVLNRYNPGLPALRFPDRAWEKFVDPDLLSGPVDAIGVKIPFTKKPLLKSNAHEQLDRAVAGGWQIRYSKPGMVDTGLNKPKISSNKTDNSVLDPERQPRMPWNDVHCRIEGPAVADLTRNFVGRWNAISKTQLPPPQPSSTYPTVGQAHIQVLRSASSKHCLKESKVGSQTDSVGTQQDIHAAMQNMIAKATQFIYIENQFFVSEFGHTSGERDNLSPAALYIKNGVDGISDTSLRVVRTLSKGDSELLDKLPQNKILPSILARLKQIILDDIKKRPFHIYITVPVHPEGAVNDPAIAVQVYYTMQTLVFGSKSLMNGIRRLLKARELKDAGDVNYLRVWQEDNNEEYTAIPYEQCYDYVTLLNLRNWEKIKTAYVTEQIYVHSKMLIVDDRFALLGSANINDRSLLGERDSELAVLIIDGVTTKVDLDGSGTLQPARKFAHDLRKMAWQKIFGITSKHRAAGELALAIDQPANPESWRAIQKQANSNKSLYEAAFPFIPRDYRYGDEDGGYASVLPTWDPTLKNSRGEITGGLASPLPFQEEFWTQLRHTEAAQQLANVKGFFTALPIHWTRNENIGIAYPTSIIVKNDKVNKDGAKSGPQLAMRGETTRTNSSDMT